MSFPIFKCSEGRNESGRSETLSCKTRFLFQQNYRAYKIRQFVKPGVTGPAQCRGLRGEFTDSELVRQRVELDFDYVGNWTLWMDVKIVLRTIGQVIFPPKSAY